MKIEYFPQTDTLSILLLHMPGSVEGEDTNDPDVTLLLDNENRIAEIVIEHASRRTDLADIRKRIGYEEIVGAKR
jgi:uncharacterized protein YuzE